MFSIKDFKRLARTVVVSLLLLNFVLIALFNYVVPALASEPDTVTPVAYQTFTSDATGANDVTSSDFTGRRLLLELRRPGLRQGSLRNVTLAGNNVTVYVPNGLNSLQTVQPLIVLHGMGGNGQTFCQGLLGFAQQNHLLLIAPTFDYNPDYLDASVVTKEDGILTAKINQMTSDLSASMHIHLKPRFLLYGFSRGSQLAHRYALLYPANTLAVVAISAGSYTLPLASFNNTPLNFSFGVNDLQNYAPSSFNQTTFDKIPFFVEVGGDDTDSSAVARAFDAYEGTNRVIRAQTFYNILKQQNVNVQLTIFPHTGHEVTVVMHAAADSFLKGVLTQH